MFRKILVPIDGSPTSNRGLDEAIKLAKDQSAALCLLHVVDDLVVTQGLSATMYAAPAYVDEFIDAMREGGKKILAKAQAKVRNNDIGCESVLLETLGRSVADIIIEQARRRRADLIVLGTHGRRGLTRMVMGSDAETVVRSTHVPVLLVRAAETPRSGRPKRGRKQ